MFAASLHHTVRHTPEGEAPEPVVEEPGEGLGHHRRQHLHQPPHAHCHHRTDRQGEKDIMKYCALHACIMTLNVNCVVYQRLASTGCVYT